MEKVGGYPNALSILNKKHFTNTIDNYFNKPNLNQMDISLNTVLPSKKPENPIISKFVDDNILNSLHNSNTKNSRKVMEETVDFLKEEDPGGHKEDTGRKSMDISAIDGTFDDFLIKDSVANENARKSR